MFRLLAKKTLIMQKTLIVYPKREAKVMTASELKYQVEEHGHEPYFFTHKTMRFFGDTMRNYGVRKTIVRANHEEGIEAWALYRKRAVKRGIQTTAYFRADNFKRINPK